MGALGRWTRGIAAACAGALSACTVFPEETLPLDLGALDAPGSDYKSSAPSAAPAETASINGSTSAANSAQAPRASTASPAPSAPQVLATAPSEDRLIFKETAKGAAPTPDAKRPERFPGKTISVNFVNAPAADVARAILSELLGAPLAVSTPTTATLTLSAPQPISGDEALSLLEAALAQSGLVLAKAETGFVLTALSEAQKQPPSFKGGAGYGVVFAPIRFSTPAEIATLIQPFLSDRLTVTADDARSVLILRGPQSDIDNAREAIAAFDAPQLIDRVQGLFRVRYAAPTTLRTEILALVEPAVGKSKIADVIALPRLNLLFVSARSQSGFDRIAAWIEKLDQPSGGDAPRLHYYPAQNTSAATLAEQVLAAYGGGGFASGASSSTTPQLDAETGGAFGGSAVDRNFRTGSGAAAGGADGLSISTDELNNALIIRATDRQYREIVELIERMDVLAPQVLIEATIAEVTLNDSLAFGIRWSYTNAESRAILSDNAAGSLGAVFPGFNYSYIDGNVRATLDTLAEKTEVTVLSTPSIMVLNNQTANLQVGDQVPIVTQTAQSVDGRDTPIVSNVQLRDTGVILEVKPRINASDVVVLEISQEVSDVADTTTSGIDSPTIQQRKFKSTVAVANNGTVALGGLIRESRSDGETGVPLLKDIPLLGYAFKSREVTKRRTELIVFLTPRIIRTDDDARAAIKALRRDLSRLGVTDGAQ